MSAKTKKNPITPADVTSNFTISYVTKAPMAVRLILWGIAANLVLGILFTVTGRIDAAFWNTFTGGVMSFIGLIILVRDRYAAN